MFYHWLLGMERNPLDWKISDLTLWLLSVSSVYLLCGRLAERENGTFGYYKIIRYGRRKDFWREVCCQQVKTVFFFAVCSFLLAAGLSYAAEAVTGTEGTGLPWKHLGTGTALFALNHSVMGVIQALFILTCGYANIVFMGMVVMELLALFFSVGSFAGWNPFNWDMVIRSELYMEAGFDIWIPVILQILVLAVMVLAGDKVLEHKMR